MSTLFAEQFASASALRFALHSALSAQLLRQRGSSPIRTQSPGSGQSPCAEQPTLAHKPPAYTKQLVQLQLDEFVVGFTLAIADLIEAVLTPAEDPTVGGYGTDVSVPSIQLAHWGQVNALCLL